MASPTVISIDLGTMGCRAAAFSEHGDRLGYHHTEYGLQHPEPGAAEQRPDDWWEATVRCMRAVVGQVEDPRSVVAIGLSAQGHSWVPTTPNFTPLRPALTWLDTRPTAIAQELLDARGAAFWGCCAGKVPGPWHTLPQVLWLRRHEPGIEDEAAYYLYAHDYLIARLTGRIATDYTTAAASLLFDVERFAWNRGLCAEYDIDAMRFAPPVAAGSVAGELDDGVAADLGLPTGTLVAVGAQDQKCAALGAGLRPGLATASLGTATAITAISGKAHYDLRARIPCFPYVCKGTWVLEAPVPTTGAAMRWLRDVARGFGADDVSHAQLAELAAGSAPGSSGLAFFPFLAGAGAPHWVAEARAGITGIGLHTTAGDIVRALMEGVACEIRGNLDAMRGQGTAIDALKLFGGGARSLLWAQIIADIAGVPVEADEDVETAGAGAAVLALAAAGVCDIPGGQSRLARGFATLEPSVDGPYEAVYADYCRRRDECLERDGRCPPRVP